MEFECRLHGRFKIHLVEYGNGVGAYCNAHSVTGRECKSRVFLTREDMKDGGTCLFGRDTWIIKRY